VLQLDQTHVSESNSKLLTPTSKEFSKSTI
jgi:hypothetical protein